DLTVKAASPLPFVTALAGAIVELPALWPRETALPDTALPCASFNVTVIVAVLEPSATTLPGLAAAVETPALTGPGVSAIANDCAKPVPFRVAETVAVPAVVPAVSVAV